MSTHERLTALGEDGMRHALAYLKGLSPDLFEEVVSDAEVVEQRRRQIRRELAERRANPVVSEITPDGRFRYQRLG